MDNNIISSILEIDRDAKDKISEAEKKKNEIIAGAKAEETRIINDKVSEADEKVRKLDEAEKASAEKKLAEINSLKEKEIERLNAVFEKRHTEWEEKIFSAVIY